ncbi:MAG: IS701 family transposase, partial [Cyanobacteria bacterium J06555_13]
CNIKRFYVRDEQAIRNHFFCALQAFCKLQTMYINGLLKSCYEISRQLFVPVIRQFILENVTESTFAPP